MSLNPLKSGQTSGRMIGIPMMKAENAMSQSPQIGANFRTEGQGFSGPMCIEKVSIPSNRGKLPDQCGMGCFRKEPAGLNPLKSGQTSGHKLYEMIARIEYSLNPLKSGQTSGR